MTNTEEDLILAVLGWEAERAEAKKNRFFTCLIINVSASQCQYREFFRYISFFTVHTHIHDYRRRKSNLSQHTA